MKGKCIRNVWILFPLNLHIRINEIVERGTGLRRTNPQIASHGELHAVHIVGSKIVIVQLGVLPRPRDVPWNPTDAVYIEIEPAVIPGYFRRMLVGRQWEAYFKAGRNLL